MSVGQKLMILKIRLTIVTLMILGNPEDAPEETVQLRGLMKLGTLSIWEIYVSKFWPPIVQIPGGVFARPFPPDHDPLKNAQP
jgi:hypothetical protein